MSLVQSFIKPIDSLFFPYSKAVVGHTIPGVLQRYPVTTVNYSDFSSALIRKTPIRDPVTKFPGMNQENTKGHPMMNQLRKLLGKKGGPLLQKGYERMSENLGWRGVGRMRDPGPLAGLDPVIHGPEDAQVLAAGVGLDL